MRYHLILSVILLATISNLLAQESPIITWTGNGDSLTKSVSTKIIRKELPLEAYLSGSISGEGGTTKYRYALPRDYDKSKTYPLVLFLHGSGGRDTDNESQLRGGNQLGSGVWGSSYNGGNNCFILCPQCPPGRQWVNWDWSKGSYSISGVKETGELKRVVNLVKKFINDFPINVNRVYVTGQSMGGYGCWDIILRHPELFAASFPVCGGGDPSQVSRIKHIPVRTAHGGKDGAIPLRASEEMVKALHAAGGDVQMIFFPEGGHSVWYGAYRLSELILWFLTQSKDGATATKTNYAINSNSMYHTDRRNQQILSAVFPKSGLYSSKSRLFMLNGKALSAESIQNARFHTGMHIMLQ